MNTQIEKISDHQQGWPRPLPGAILILPALLVVADFPEHLKVTAFLMPSIEWLKLNAIIAIRHLLDFSYKVCHCCSTLQILGSTFNQKGEHMNGS